MIGGATEADVVGSRGEASPADIDVAAEAGIAVVHREPLFIFKVRTAWGVGGYWVGGGDLQLASGEHAFVDIQSIVRLADKIDVEIGRKDVSQAVNGDNRIAVRIPSQAVAGQRQAITGLRYEAFCPRRTVIRGKDELGSVHQETSEWAGKIADSAE